MAIPQKFPPVGPNVLANYNYSDVADGIGYTTFYAAKAEKGNYLLSPTVVRSEVIEISGSARYLSLDSGGVQNSGSTTFPFSGSSFNYPKVVKGNAVVQCYYMAEISGGGAVTPGKMVIGFDVLKNSTIIGSFSGSQFDISAVGLVNTSGSLLYTIPLTQTHFARGDVLVLRYNQWGASNSGQPVGEFHVVVGIDPGDRRGAFIKPTSNAYPDVTSILKVAIPFRLDDVN